jgi:hypothetical protein
VGKEMVREMAWETLIERLNERAHDPKRVRDENDGFQDSNGKPVVFVASLPVTLEQVAEAEQRLGFSLPTLLRQMYLEVGNGGFGPGYGLFSLTASDGNSIAHSIVGDYTTLRQMQTAPHWPIGLIPICEWGCGISSYLDCTRPEVPVVRLDPNMVKGNVAKSVPAGMHYDRANQLKDACWVEAVSLEEWLTAWVDGKKLFYLAYGETGTDADAEYEDEDDEDDEEE